MYHRRQQSSQVAWTCQAGTLMAQFKRIAEDAAPASKKQGFLLQIIDHSVPEDHGRFVEARRSGRKAIKQNLERRRRKA